MIEISSYPKIYQAGHRICRDILLDLVLIQEKVDGSQISFGVYDGVLAVRSKGVQLNVGAPEKMFAKAVEQIKSRQHLLHPNWTYRGEYLNSPSHNTLVYDRVPEGNIALFDVMTGVESYTHPGNIAEEASRLSFDAVPTYFYGQLSSLDEAKQYLNRPSFLGGAIAEGVVIKNHFRFDSSGKPLMVKFVTPQFKEMHVGEWRSKNPTQSDIRQEIAERVCTPARWHKAVQHLREAGRLKDDPSDIGLLMKEVSCDLDGECLDEITRLLLNWALKDIKRAATRGLAEWYKEQLFADRSSSEASPEPEETGSDTPSPNSGTTQVEE